MTLGSRKEFTDRSYEDEPGSLFDDPVALLREDDEGAPDSAEFESDEADAEPERDEDGLFLPDEDSAVAKGDAEASKVLVKLGERARAAIHSEEAADDSADAADLARAEHERQQVDADLCLRRDQRLRLLNGGVDDKFDAGEPEEEAADDLEMKSFLRLLRAEDENLSTDGDPTIYRAITLSPEQLTRDLREAMTSLLVHDRKFADEIARLRPKVRRDCNASPVTNNFEPRDECEWVDPESPLNWAVKKAGDEDIVIQSGDNVGADFSANDTFEEAEARMEACDRGIPFKTKAEAIHDRDVVRRCPLFLCRYHPFLDVNPETGALKLHFPFRITDPTQLPGTCILDIADASPDGITLDEIGIVTNQTRERVRQTEVRALIRVEAASRALEEGKTLAEILAGYLVLLDALQEPDRSIYEIDPSDPEARLVDQDVGLDFRPLSL